MKIAFDVDGVVLKSIDVILEHVSESTGRSFRSEDLKSWDLDPLGLDRRTLQNAVEYMFTMKRIETYANAVEVLSRIHRITEEPLLFITGRTDPNTALRQLEALSWEHNPELVVTGGDRDKRRYMAEMAVDFLVEDDPAHLQDYLDIGFGVGLMVRPWNQSVGTPVTARFHDWNDVESWFLNAWRARRP